MLELFKVQAFSAQAGGRGRQLRSLMKAHRFPETKNNCSSAPNEENGDEARLPVALTFTDSHSDSGSMGTELHKTRAWLRLRLGSSQLWLLWRPCWRLYTHTANQLTQSRAPLLNPRSKTVPRLNTGMCVCVCTRITVTLPRKNDCFLFSQTIT